MAAQPVPGNYVSRSAIGMRYNAGAPVAGTNEVQTLTLANITGGNFAILFDGFRTAAITWSATTATLLANIQAALDALPNGGTNWIVATDSTLSGGNGNLLLTYSGGDLAHKAVPNVSVDGTNLTGSGAAITVAETTPGVDATAREAPLGTVLTDTTNKKLYINTSATLGAPTWTVAGSQS